MARTYSDCTTQDPDDMYVDDPGVSTRRRTYRSPYASPAPSPAKRPRVSAAQQASSPDLDVVPETGAAMDEAQPPVEPEDEDASESPLAPGRGGRPAPFTWTDGGDVKLYSRNLKLALGVFEAKAYDCPHGTMEARWRQVVAYLKSNNSRLFALLEAEDTTSWRRVRTYWAGDPKKNSDGLFLEWDRAMTRRANTSGAAEDYTEFDKAMENIKKAIRDGAGKLIPKRKNSFGVDNGTLHRINLALSGSLGDDTTAHAAATRTAEEILRAGNEGRIRDGVVQPEPEPEPQAPAAAERKRRGKQSIGTRDIVDELNAGAKMQAEVEIARIQAEKEARQETNKMFTNFFELQERRLQAETERQAQQDARQAQQDTHRREMDTQNMQTMAQTMQSMQSMVNVIGTFVEKMAEKKN